MAWRKAKCLAGHQHNVYVQERKNSCGPSCVMMAYNRLWDKEFDEKLAYEAYVKYGGGDPAYDGTQYSYTNRLASALSKFCGKAYQHQETGELVTQRIIDSIDDVKKPLIVLTEWDLPGGHFVLIDRLYMVNTDRYACVCDPYDGYVHPVRLNIGGTTRYEPGYSSGAFSQWTVGFAP